MSGVRFEFFKYAPHLVARPGIDHAVPSLVPDVDVDGVVDDITGSDVECNFTVIALGVRVNQGGDKEVTFDAGLECWVHGHAQLVSEVVSSQSIPGIQRVIAQVAA